MFLWVLGKPKRSLASDCGDFLERGPDLLGKLAWAQLVAPTVSMQTARWMWENIQYFEKQIIFADKFSWSDNILWNMIENIDAVDVLYGHRDDTVRLIITVIWK